VDQLHIKTYRLDALNPYVPIPEDFVTPCRIHYESFGVEIDEMLAPTMDTWEIALLELMESMED